MAKQFIQKPYPIYVLTPEAIFYDLRQILLNIKHPRACNLDINQPMLIDIELKKLLFEFEKRYGKPIPEAAGFKGVLTIKDFCEICSKVITKKVPAKMPEVLDFIKYILVASTQLNKSDLTNTVKMGRDWHIGKKGLGLDDLNRLETIINLEEIYDVEISETNSIKKANTLIEFAQACCDEINEKIKQKSLTIKSDYTKRIDKIVSEVKPVVVPESKPTYNTYESIQEAIKKHLETEYDRYNVVPKNNWFTNLNLSELQRCDFFEWVEKKFEIKLPYFYFENMDALYKTIYYTKLKQNNFISRIKERIAKSK